MDATISQATASNDTAKQQVRLVVKLGDKIAALFGEFGGTVEAISTEPVFRLFRKNTQRNVSHGWLWIEDCGDCWSVTLANGQHSHCRAGGARAYAIDVLKASGERDTRYGRTGVHKTAIGLWPVHDESEAIQIFDVVNKRISLAYQHHCRQVEDVHFREKK